MISKRITEGECADMGNAYPSCAPAPSDTWSQGAEYKFVWNYNFPYYISNQSQADSWIDLHVYFRKNYAFEHIKEWTNLRLLDGSLTVTVDDSWFPTPAQSGNMTWTLYGYYLPAGMNASQELLSTYSMFPRPFNFSAVQLGDGSSGGGASGGTGSNGDTPLASDGSSSGSQHLPGWAIAVIVIACLALAAVIAAILGAIWYFRRRQKAAAAAAAAAASSSSSSPPPPMSQANITNNSSRNAVGPGAEPSPTATPHSNSPKPQGYDGESIYSSTPMVAAVAATGTASARDSSTTDGSHGSRPRTSPPADTFRNLLQHYPDWKAVLPGQEEGHDEAQRRRLGEALLQRELEEEGAAVKHTDHRALPIQTVAPPHEPQESTAVVLERSPSSA